MNITVKKIDDINIILSGTIQGVETKANDDDAKCQREEEAKLLQTFIESGMKKAGLTEKEMLGQPNFKKYEKSDDTIVLEVQIATKPIIDVDVEYMDIVPKYKEEPIDAKVIDEKLLLMAKKQAPFTALKSPRAVQMGDLVSIDFEGFLHDKPLAAANEKEYKLLIGSKSFIDGFEEQIVGMHIGEHKSINITFPKEYKTKELAGQVTRFEVTLNDFQEQIPIEVDDDRADWREAWALFPGDVAYVWHGALHAGVCGPTYRRRLPPGPRGRTASAVRGRNRPHPGGLPSRPRGRVSAGIPVPA